jgi:KUP system potassium uptake protein
LFGPVMFVWFTMIAIMGCVHLADNLSIFKAINPFYAINFLIHYKGAFILLGRSISLYYRCGSFIQ